MDKKQFCQMLKDARKLSGIGWLDLSWKLKKTQSAIVKMLDCKEDYGMKKVFEYLGAVNSEIILSSNREIVATLYSLESLSKWITVSYDGVLQKEIQKRIDVPQQTLSRILHGGDVRMSTFLKMAEDQKLSIHVQLNEVNALIDSVNDCDIE